MNGHRLALLPLTGAGEALCRHCDLRLYQQDGEGHAEPTCPIDATVRKDSEMRSVACIQAERDASRLRAVEAAARALIEAVDAYYATTSVRDIDDSVLAKKRAETALRAALKEP